MEKENDKNKLAEEINKRLQALIDHKKSESEALKKILKAFSKNEDNKNKNIENIKKQK